MRIVILGAGEAGQQLAERLSEEKHEVVMVDRQDIALEQGEAQYDVMTVRGSASSPRVLRDAQIEKADILVAVTGSDEANILACIHAKAAGVPHKLARVSDRDFLLKDSPLNLKAAGVDCLVCPQEENAHELMNMLLAPGLEQVVDLLDGRLYAIAIEMPVDSPVIGHTLREFMEHELIPHMRVLAAVREGEVFVPNGETQFYPGDLVHMVVQRSHLEELQDWLMPSRRRVNKVIVAGGGSFGLYLTQVLENSFKQVVLIERDAERAEFCSGVLKKTLVLRGDVLDLETIQNAGVTSDTAFVSVTDDDEDNIIACLLARKLGCALTMTQLRKPEYVPVVDQLDLIDRVISPHISLMAAVLGFIRGEEVHAARILKNLEGELLDIIVDADSRIAGQSIQALKLPKGCVIAAVVRDSEVFIPVGSLEVKAGDRLMFFSLSDCSKKLIACCKE